MARDSIYFLEAKRVTSFSTDILDYYFEFHQGSMSKNKIGEPKIFLSRRDAGRFGREDFKYYVRLLFSTSWVLKPAFKMGNNFTYDHFCLSSVCLGWNQLLYTILHEILDHIFKVLFLKLNLLTWGRGTASLR